MGSSRSQPPSPPDPTSLDSVIAWWSAPANTPGLLQSLGREIRRSCRRRRAILASAAGFLAVGEPAPPPPGRPDLPAGLDRLDPALHRLLWNYALADEIARRYQSAQRRTCLWLLVFVAILGAGFWLLKHAALLLPEDLLLFDIPIRAAVPGLLIGLGLIVSRILQKQFQRKRDRFLVSRNLAEALRIDLAQRLAGSGMDTLAEFSRQHEFGHGSTFSRVALEAARECAAAESPLPGPSEPSLARALWLEDQLQFFGAPDDTSPQGPDTSRVERERTRQERAQSRMKVLVKAALALLLLSFALPGAVSLRLDEIPETWDTGLHIAGAVAELLAAIFGLYAAYYQQMAALHSVTAQKYHRARLYLIDALAALDRAETDAERKAIFARIGRQALAETADWGVHQREHTPQTSFH